MDFFEFIKISTIGPPHLRLNEDVLRLIQEFMSEPQILLVCKNCECTLLTERNNKMCMEIEYFTNIDTDTHVCYNCSRFRNAKKFFDATNLDSNNA